MNIGIFGKTIRFDMVSFPPLIQWGLAYRTKTLSIYPQSIARMLTSESAFHDAAPPLTRRLGVFLVVTIFIASQFSHNKTGTEMTLKELIPLLMFFRLLPHP